jgi:sodium transport system permease protein
MKAWLEVFRKEAVENARDRRAVAAALLYGPLVGPVLFAVLMGFILGKQQEQAEQVLSVPVIGAEHAPNLVRFLRQEGVRVLPPPEDPELSVRDHTHSVVLRILPEFPQHWREGRPAPVELLFDASRQQARIPSDRILHLLDGYSRQTGVLRLQVRGLDPQIAFAVDVMRRDLSTPQSRAGMIMALLPYMLLLSAFIGGMYLAIDTTAGERERQSLEPLLMTPASRGEILWGKMLATTAYAAASLSICVLAFVVGLRFVPTGGLGVDLALPTDRVLLLLIVVAPVAMLAATSETVVASFAKSFREAQTYLQFLLFLPAIPGVIMAINPVPPESWMMLTPLLSQTVLLMQITRGDPMAAADIAWSIGTTVALAVLLGMLAVYLFKREQTVLGTT